MAYLCDLVRARCRTCNAVATCELYNRFNAPAGTFCRKHGKQELTAMQAREDGRPVVTDSAEQGRPSRPDRRAG